MPIALNFDTFAAWFISAEIESQSAHPNLFQDTLDSFTDGGTPTDDDFYNLACSLLGDSRDDLVINHERLIMISDRAAEYISEDQEYDNLAGEYHDSQLDADMFGWLDDDRLARGLAEAYKAQWEFNNMIMENMRKRDALNALAE
jgi:hypothetical protein